jgi:hypothetical protein
MAGQVSQPGGVTTAAPDIREQGRRPVPAYRVFDPFREQPRAGADGEETAG